MFIRAEMVTPNVLRLRRVHVTGTAIMVRDYSYEAGHKMMHIALV